LAFAGIVAESLYVDSAFLRFDSEVTSLNVEQQRKEKREQSLHHFSVEGNVPAIGAERDRLFTAIKAPPPR